MRAEHHLQTLGSLQTPQLLPGPSKPRRESASRLLRRRGGPQCSQRGEGASPESLEKANARGLCPSGAWASSQACISGGGSCRLEELRERRSPSGSGAVRETHRRQGESRPCCACYELKTSRTMSLPNKQVSISTDYRYRYPGSASTTLRVKPTLVRYPYLLHCTALMLIVLDVPGGTRYRVLTAVGGCSPLAADEAG